GHRHRAGRRCTGARRCALWRTWRRPRAHHDLSAARRINQASDCSLEMGTPQLINEFLDTTASA
ncbi:hypothetical protein ABT314_26900, partial [Streptomyces spiralis]